MGNSIRLVVLQALLVGVCLTTGNLVPTAFADQPGQAHLYFITNEGCAPCRQVEPAIEALKREGYPVTTVNFDANRQWATSNGVDRTPTVILIANNKMVGRHSGLIDGVTLKRWFSAVGINSGSAFANGQTPPRGGTKQVIPGKTGEVRGTQAMREFNSPTMLKGTDVPGDRFEKLAMQATVRLKVEDPDGTSYATGTVIHSFKGESLVITCGHVFRDSKGTGKVSAEYGFDTGNLQAVPGEMISYDAKARDIGLVAIKTRVPIAPVPIADRESSIDRGRDVFSIGCDHGDAPTIRHSRIKNMASYDGSIKYDIFGRPVDGRSGGGLFTKRGELIGICNAACVEVDEGIYTALDTIYWQIAKLDHLFDRSQVATAPTPRMPVPGAAAQTHAINPSTSGFTEQVAPGRTMAPLRDSGSVRTDVSTEIALASAGGVNDDREVVILIRSKSNPSQARTVTIDNPTPKLLNYLEAMDNGHLRQIEMARMRTVNGGEYGGENGRGFEGQSTRLR